MKQRILSILMTLCLCLTLLPTAAFADDEGGDGEVAQIGDVKYGTLVEAVTAAQNNDTVTLLKSTEGTGITVVRDKTVTIDLNGYTYMVTTPVGDQGYENNGAYLLPGSTVTLKNGTFKCTLTDTKFWNLIENHGNLTLTDITLDIRNATYSKIAVLCLDGNVTITGNTNIYAGPNRYAVNVRHRHIGTTNPTVTFDAAMVGFVEGRLLASCYEWVSDRGGDGPNGEKWSDEKKDDNAKLNISGGYFIAAPDEYVTDGYYVNPSDVSGYTYVVNNVDNSNEHPIYVSKGISIDTLRISGSVLTEDDREYIEETVNVVGVDLALDKAQIATANISGNDFAVADKLVVYVEVDIKVTNANLDSGTGTLTYTAKPYVVIIVTADGITTENNPTSVPNSMLTGKPITMTLPLPEGFMPKQIKHTSSDDTVEYFINETEGGKRGAGSFTIKEINGGKCAVFTITQFSTFDLSEEVTYVEPPAPASPRPSYDVTVADTENGSVTLDRGTVPQGGKVTITAEGDDGYRVGSVTALDKNGNPVPVTKVGYGVYSAVVPSGGLTVAVEFEPEMPFADVPVEKYFYCAVRWANENGIVGGTSATTFSPYASCTRGQLVTFLWRALGEPEAKTAENPFTDVKEGSAFYQAILWASENNIVGGYDDGTFRPSAAITRQQAAAILYRYAAFAGLDVSASDDLADFKDAGSVSAYALPAMKWAVGDGILWGSNGYLLPASACTRAQIVSFLYRFLG